MMQPGEGAQHCCTRPIGDFDRRRVLTLATQFPRRSHPRCALSLIALPALVLAAAPAQAVTYQHVYVEHVDNPDPTFVTSSETSDFDTVIAPDGQVPDRTIEASVASTTYGYSADAAIDPFGNLSMSVATYGGGTTASYVSVANDEFINPYARPVQVTTTVLVDGGALRVLGPEGSEATLDLRVATFEPTFDTDPERFNDIVDSLITTQNLDASLEMAGFYSDPLLSVGHDDFVVYEPEVGFGFESEIPIQLIELDLGVIAPGASFGISYDALITASADGPAEIVSADYRDPLSVIFTAPTLTPIGPPLAPVPLPAGLWMLIGGLSGLGAVRRFTRTRSTI